MPSLPTHTHTHTHTHAQLDTRYEDSGYLATAFESLTLPLHKGVISLYDGLGSLGGTDSTNIHTLAHRLDVDPARIHPKERPGWRGA
jgi:hypothetical protein